MASCFAILTSWRRRRVQLVKSVRQFQLRTSLHSYRLRLSVKFKSIILFYMVVSRLTTTEVVFCIKITTVENSAKWNWEKCFLAKTIYVSLSQLPSGSFPPTSESSKKLWFSMVILLESYCSEAIKANSFDFLSMFEPIPCQTADCMIFV